MRDTLPDAQGSGRGVNVQPDPTTGAPSTLTLRSSLIEQNHEVGVFVDGSEATIEASAVRDTEPNHDGRFGDGVVVISLPAAATGLITSTRIESSARAGLANFGASVTLDTNVFDCNTIDIDGEKEFFGPSIPYSFPNPSGNVCGCAAEQWECGVVSSGLEPPDPIAEWQ